MKLKLNRIILIQLVAILFTGTLIADDVVETLAPGVYLHLDRVNTQKKLITVECFVNLQRKKLQPKFDETYQKAQFQAIFGGELTNAERKIGWMYNTLEFLAIPFQTSTVGEFCTFKTDEMKNLAPGLYTYDILNLREKSDAYIAYVSSSADSSSGDLKHMMKHVEMIVSVNTSASVPWYTPLGICRSALYEGEKHPAISIYLHDFIARNFPDKLYMLTNPLKKMRDIITAAVGNDNAQVLRETNKSDRWVDITPGAYAAGEGKCTYIAEDSKRVNIPRYGKTWFATNSGTFGSRGDGNAALVVTKREALASYAAAHPYGAEED